MTAQQIIDQAYFQIETQGLNTSQKAQVYYTVIAIKNAENIIDIYLDVKHFLKNYIISIDEKNYNYDTLDPQKILSVVNFLSIEQQVGILGFLKKLFIRYQCEDEWKQFEPEFYRAKVHLLKTQWFWINPLNLFKLLYFKLSYSRVSLFLTLLAFVILDIIVLLPNRWNIWASMFQVEYESISPSFWQNHIINVLFDLFEFDTDFAVLPLSLISAIMLIVGKLIKILVIVQYIIDKIIKRIDFND